MTQGLRVRRASDRGHANHGWLVSWHTFSFADYHDPEAMGFSILRVINEDRVAPGQGFGTHGHRDMEIVSYVLAGALEHRDSMGNGSVMRPGDVQRMSAGTGVTHSEFNASRTEPLHFLQIWLIPRQRGIPPSYEQRRFEVEDKLGRLRLIASPDGAQGSVTLNADARIHATVLDAESALNLSLPEGRKAWLQVVSGRLSVGGATLEAGDGAAFERGGPLDLRALERAEALLFDLPE